MYTQKINEFSLRQLKSLVALKEFAIKYNIHEMTVMETGYNTYSGLVYIAYEEGLTIAIFEGRGDENSIRIFGYDMENNEIEYDSLKDYFDDTILEKKVI